MYKPVDYVVLEIVYRLARAL